MITDYASLIAAVAAHLDRDDLTGEMSRFVQMAEGYLKRRLRSLDMEISTTETVSDATFALPANALSIRSIHIVGDPDQHIPDRPLRAISPAAMAELYSGFEGTPTAYSRSGETITLSAPPDEEITLAIIYIAKFTPLTDETSNWIMDNYPDIYFYGALEQAYSFDKDEARAGESRGLFRDAVEELVLSRSKDKWGPGAAVPVGVNQVRGARC